MCLIGSTPGTTTSGGNGRSEYILRQRDFLTFLQSTVGATTHTEVGLSTFFYKRSFLIIHVCVVYFKAPFAPSDASASATSLWRHTQMGCKAIWEQYRSDVTSVRCNCTDQNAWNCRVMSQRCRRCRCVATAGCNWALNVQYLFEDKTQIKGLFKCNKLSNNHISQIIYGFTSICTGVCKDNWAEILE